MLRGHGQGFQGQQPSVKDLVSLFEGESKTSGSSVTDTAFPGRGTFNGAQRHQQESIPSVVDYYMLLELRPVDSGYKRWSE